MKKEKIEELFNQNADIMNGVRVLFDTDFVQAINQAEKEMKLEWYRELEKDLYDCSSYGRIGKFYEYKDEIQNKIKELENGHSQDR